MKKFTTIASAIAVAALCAAPAMAQPPSNSDDIEVNVTVQAFVEVQLIDNAINWVSDGTGPWNNDLSGIGNTPGVHRARFKVLANDDYFLTVTAPDGTWPATNLLPHPWHAYKQVLFAGTGDYQIGGTFYLDRTPDIGPITHYWDGNLGNLKTENFAAEVHTWGLSAGFAPELVRSNAIPGGIENMVAPVDTYSATALITASLAP